MIRFVACFVLVFASLCGSKKPEKSGAEENAAAPRLATEKPPAEGEALAAARAVHERELGLICESAAAAAKKDGDKRPALLELVEGKFETSEAENIFNATQASDKKYAHALLRQGALELGIRDWECEFIAGVFGPQEATAQFVDTRALARSARPPRRLSNQRGR